MGSGGTYTIFKISSGTLAAGLTTGLPSVEYNYNFELDSNGDVHAGRSSAFLYLLTEGSGNPTFSVTFPPNYILLGLVAVADDGDVTGMIGELVETSDDFPSAFANLELVDLSLSTNPSIDNIYTGDDSGLSVTITPSCAITGYNSSTKSVYISSGTCLFTYKVTVYILAEYVSCTDL